MPDKTSTENKTDIARVDGERQGSMVPQPTLTIDYALYEKHLENCDLSEEEKQEFLDTLWSVIVGFVDLGFGVHPLQQAAAQNPGACGQEIDLSSLMASDVISSSKSVPTTQFSNVAAPPKTRASKMPEKMREEI